MIDQVRRFNRAVTQRAGALDDAFLARGHPLGQARVLWEIGPDGCDVRDLRARLDLDSGYLSRLLRALERDGLVTVEASEADGRIGRRGSPRPERPNGPSSTACLTTRPSRCSGRLASGSAAGCSPPWRRWSGCWPPRPS